MFEHVETPTINDIDLLKIGRHFRLDNETKLVVGRNKDENEMIKAIALPNDILFEARDHMGPVSILRGKTADNHIEFASSVTLRYSDAPQRENGYVNINKNSQIEDMAVKPAAEESYLKFRI